MTNLDQVRVDKLDIAEVIVAYATAIDRRDWDLFRTVFTDELDVDYDDIGNWHDRETLTQFMVEAHLHLGHTMHRLSNVAIDVAGDEATAHAYVDAVLMTADGKSGIQAIGFYDDALVRTSSGWRITKRHFTMVHTTEL
jgi:hypothetical protein